jgi:hypothetical protein
VGRRFGNEFFQWHASPAHQPLAPGFELPGKGRHAVFYKLQKMRIVGIASLSLNFPGSQPDVHDDGD